jgi:transcriptional regulator GlxA family with amidase domain
METDMVERTKPVVALLAAPETSPSVLYGLYDVLYSVGAVYPDMTIGEPGPEALDVRIVAAQAEPFRCVGNVTVEPHASIDAIERANVVIVCDMYTPINEPPRGKYPRETAWLRKMHAAGALVCSVCSGSLVLAEAGLLDNRGAAAHWAYSDLFRRCYPTVKMHEESVLCMTEERGGIVTAGAVTAWQDLAIYLIARLCGKQQALRTAKVFLLSGHEDGQLPFAAMVRRIETSDRVIADCQSWIAESYAAPNPVQRMIARSGLNPRTFARRFRAATGYQPIDYVQALRIEEAKQILETEELGIDEIAETVGYDDPASFRRLFKRKAGLTPAAYRRKFAGLVATGLR